MQPYHVIGIGILAAGAAILTGCFVEKARPHVFFLAFFVPAHMTLSFLVMPLGVDLLIAHGFGSDISNQEIGAGLVIATLNLPLTVPAFFLFGPSIVSGLLCAIPLNSLTAGLIFVYIRARRSRRSRGEQGMEALG